MQIPLNVLGAPGVQGELIIKAMFRDRDNDNPIRLSDQSERDFEIKAKLSKDPPSAYDMNGAFDRLHGNSFFLAPDQVSHFEVEFANGTLRLDTNDQREVSMASATIRSFTPASARHAFLDLLTRYLDRMAYVAGVPTHIAMTVVRDLTHEVQYLSFTGPPRPVTVNSGGEALFDEMKPIYALYREAMNSSSPYYRVLCFYKIMEGLQGPLRVGLRKRARTAGVPLPRSKDRVPDHPDFPIGLKEYVSKPLKDFFDNFLSKQYRDAMAHFTLKRGGTLDVSSAGDQSRFTDVAFVADLCTRGLVATHEELLRALIAQNA